MIRGEGIRYMKLSHQIPFHMDKEKNFTIFYDDEEELFYRKYTKINNKPIYLYSGVTATITYSLLSGVTYNLFSEVPFLPVIISFLAAIVFLALTKFLAEKNFDKTGIHYFDILNEEYLYTLIVEGERALHNYIAIIIGMFVLDICLMIALFVNPNEFILFLCHTIFWWVFFVLIFTGNIFKRKKLYRLLREKIE